jgi:PPOX class probable F420-dependent enzyme
LKSAEEHVIDLKSTFGRKARRHLEDEYFVWLTTVGRDLAPQPRPVWFIWEKDSFLIFSEPKAHKVSHLRQHQGVSLHFNTSDGKGEQDVIVFVGKALIDPDAPPAHEVRAYLKKYKTGIAELDMTPEEFSSRYSVTIRVTPGSVRGW